MTGYWRLRRREKLELHAIDIGFGDLRGPCFFLEGLSLLIKIDGLFVHILLVVLHLEGNRARGVKFEAHREAVVFQRAVRREGNHQRGRVTVVEGV